MSNKQKEWVLLEQSASSITEKKSRLQCPMQMQISPIQPIKNKEKNKNKKRTKTCKVGEQAGSVPACQPLCHVKPPTYFQSPPVATPPPTFTSPNRHACKRAQLPALAASDLCAEDARFRQP